MQVYMHCVTGNRELLEFEKTYTMKGDMLMDGAFDYIRVN